jgi:hypothetical protein
LQPPLRLLPDPIELVVRRHVHGEDAPVVAEVRVEAARLDQRDANAEVPDLVVK